MRMTEIIRSKLSDKLFTQYIDISDDSSLHAGHSGARPGGETHFTVTVVSASFEGLPRVRRHRLVHGALEEELKTRIHALAITALTPGEYKVKPLS